LKTKKDRWKCVNGEIVERLRKRGRGENEIGRERIRECWVGRERGERETSINNNKPSIDLED
jgi:hypothetical protein